MDLTQIRYFLALASTLNFTRAAEVCNITQPALTNSIQRLEEEFGSALLLRERDCTRLTPLGAAMLPLLQRTLDATEAAGLNARRCHGQVTARLRLGLGNLVPPDIVVPLVAELAQCFPSLELTIRQGDISMLNECLLSSEIDVSLTVGSGGLTERANHWTLFADAIVAHVPEHHPLAGLDRLNLASFEEHALVGRLDGVDADRHGEARLEACLPAGVAIRHRGGSEEHVDAMVRSGIGIALATARRPLPHGVVRRPIEPATCVAIVVAAIADRPMSLPAGNFIRLARARSWDDAPVMVAAMA